MTHTTPDMNLVLPDILGTVGPSYAYDWDAAAYLIDAHDHSTGKGVKITPSGLNISSDLTISQNNITDLRSARLFNNSSFTPGINDKTCLYSLNDELYFIDGAGNDIQITLNGAIDLSSGLVALNIKDTNLIIENASDVSKKFRFDASAVPTSTTRVISIPESGANDTLVSLAATQTLTNKTLTSPTLNSPTISSPSGLTKSDVGLGNVDNTSDATKNSATATLSNKSVTGPLVVLADTTVQFNNAANTFSTSLKAGANAADVTFSLPISDGTVGQLIQTNGSGQLSWTSGSTSAATSTTAGTIPRYQDWTSYTPSFTGLGTVTLSSRVLYKVVGDSMFIRGSITTGTVTAALASISIPGGFTISGSKSAKEVTTGNPGSYSGWYISSGGPNNSGGTATCTNTSTSVIYFCGNTVIGTTMTTPQNGNAIFVSSGLVNFLLEVPLV